MSAGQRFALLTHAQIDKLACDIFRVVQPLPPSPLLQIPVESDEATSYLRQPNFEIAARAGCSRIRTRGKRGRRRIRRRECEGELDERASKPVNSMRNSRCDDDLEVREFNEELEAREPEPL